MISWVVILEDSDLEACECNQVNALFARGQVLGWRLPHWTALYCIQRTLARTWSWTSATYRPQAHSWLDSRFSWGSGGHRAIGHGIHPGKARVFRGLPSKTFLKPGLCKRFGTRHIINENQLPRIFASVLYLCIDVDTITSSFYNWIVSLVLYQSLIIY